MVDLSYYFISITSDEKKINCSRFIIFDLNVKNDFVDTNLIVLHILIDIFSLQISNAVEAGGKQVSGNLGVNFMSRSITTMSSC